ncbi:uncharacterized protein L3040_008770 [Drepanopeziza brunnea f. sp. 'multigermtubi']|uniref:Uncharacterized protein n=1 Tax=Marssonina brunnea f. sp. multigermtubi (strain MB_m1) TaxID=1072389 RepID=K1Y0T1_MARBU|nr:uncharacterized protein MBM_02966 [Drepanopeziza brunnea f. sp. 'multigermtubi' MB_m1]EKD18724.1 hypothetical protein MBM_02966 [Drepanopeziza brunnea f. sp. 'multigermtubi' MB_m1]KAJ5033658.1 hypothetical protein L3040_008770 [Drepanopeziza brunnea f. sp. 'multigermtubi']
MSPDLVQAYSRYLQGASEVTVWSEAVVIDLLRATGAHIEQLEGKIKEFEQLPPANTLTPSKPATPMIDTAGSTSTQSIPATSSTSGTTARHSRSPRLATTNPSSDTGFAKASIPSEIPDSSDDEQEDTIVRELRAQLSSCKGSLDREQRKSLWAFAAILKAHECGPWLTEESLAPVSNRVRECMDKYCRPSEARAEIILQPKYALALADDFDDKPSKPIRPFSSMYLQMLTAESITCHHDKAFPLSEIYVNDILWLTARLPEITFSMSHSDGQNLYEFIDEIVGNVVLVGLGRPALFMLIANLKQRCPEITRFVSGIYTQVGRGDLGKPYTDWDSLTRIAFFWLMSHGSDMDPSFVHIPPQLRQGAQQYVQELTSKQPRDFLSLLNLPCTKEFLEGEGLAGYRSLVLSIKKSINEQMVILRCASGSSPRLASEFIWVTHQKKCWFSERGLEFLWRYEGGPCAKGYARPVSTHNVPWFEVTTDEEDDFLTPYYAHEIRESYENYLLLEKASAT